VADPPTPSVAEEAALLRDANDALVAGDGPRALSLLDRYAARVGTRGVLVQEYDAARAVALCQLHRAGGGAAEAFASKYPRSPFAARVSDACGSGSTGR
jgi:hypothetical protein